MQNTIVFPQVSVAANDHSETPEVTGALLSRMLTSMQDLGDAANQILASRGVTSISLDDWYPRSLQHDCFNEVQRRFGEPALYAVGFAYQSMVRERYAKEVAGITQQLQAAALHNRTPEIERATDFAIDQLIALLHQASVNNVRNHPVSYGFFSARRQPLEYCVSFSSFAVASLTSYAQAIIYGMVRLAFPPQWTITIDLDSQQRNRREGHHADHFLVRLSFGSSSVSLEEMRLQETLQVKQKLLLAAMTAAQAEHDKAAKLLADHLDSVTYASRLQKNLLVPNELLNKRFSEFRAIWEPREIVGGDIYWTTSSVSEQDEHFSLALFDCTGHGVPGAMLSLLVTSAIDRIFANHPEIAPDAALMAVDGSLRAALHQRGTGSDIDDGCDAAIIRIYPAIKIIEYSGAKLALIKVGRSGQIDRINPTRISLGYQDAPATSPQLHRIPFEAHDTFVMVTDGFTDQIGGRIGAARSYGNKRLSDIMSANANKSVAEISGILKEDFDQWQGSQIRRDDLTVLIFRP